MLKNRQDGLLFLHGFILMALVTALFVVLAVFCRWAGIVKFNTEVNWSLYVMAVLVAMVWNHHGLGGVGDKLGSLSFFPVSRLTFHQVSRLLTVLVTLAYATKDVEMSRAFFALFIVSASALLFLANLYLPRILSKLLFRGLRLRTLVLTREVDAERLAGWFSRNEHLGQDIVGWVGSGVSKNDPRVPNVPFLGVATDLPRIMQEKNANHLMISRSCFSSEQLDQFESLAERQGCRLHYFIDLGEAFGTASASLDSSNGYAFATHTNEPLDNPVNRFSKRVLDLAISIPVVCLVLPPLTVLVWAYQRFQSPGPVFHRQERSGLNRQRFHIFKFRTMHIRSHGDEGRQASASDSRVFPFGRLMRRTSLDEFPQFINVLLGQMSVSGPRPHLLEHDKRFAEIVGIYYRRHFVKPGITGLAQSEGFRGEIKGDDILERRIAHDLQYVTRWSLLLDIRIIFSTAWQVIRPPSTAY